MLYCIAVTTFFSDVELIEKVLKSLTKKKIGRNFLDRK